MFSNESESDRETIWRFLNNQIEKPKINNIPLIFGTYQTNYPDLYFYHLYNKLENKQDEQELVKLCLQHKQPTKALEKYFPELFEKINVLNAKYFSTKMFMFLNNGEFPKCEICRKTSKRT